MVRVAGLVDHSSAGTAPSDGREPDEVLHEIADRVRGARGRAGDESARLAAARARRGGPAGAHAGRMHGGRAAPHDRDVRAGDLPRPDPARGRPGTALPVHLEPVAVAGRVRRRPADGRAAVRAREGARGAAAVPGAGARPPLRRPRGRDRRQPAPPVPRHGVHGARHVPRHARRRLRHLGGRRGPARGRRAGAPRAPLRRRRAARGRGHHVGRDAGRHRRRPARAPRPRVPRAPSARPGRLLPARVAGPPRPALPAVVAADAAAAERRLAERRHVRRDPPWRHPRPPPVRRLRHVGRALHRAGRRRSRRARHQAHHLPHLRRLADRAGPGARGRAGQAGRGDGRGDGAVRRGAQHPLGALAGARRRARGLRPRGAEDALQARDGRPSRGGRRPPLRPHRHRQLPPVDRAAVHRPRAVHVPRGRDRRRARTSSTT